MEHKVQCRSVSGIFGKQGKGKKRGAVRYFPSFGRDWILTG